MLRLSKLSGNKSTMKSPLISLEKNFGLVLSSTAVSLLDIKEGDRVDFAVITNAENVEELYIAKVINKTEGRAVSKHGKLQQEMIHSWISDLTGGTDAEITSETTVAENLIWHKIVKAVVKVEEVVVEEAVDTTVRTLQAVGAEIITMPSVAVTEEIAE